MRTSSRLRSILSKAISILVILLNLALLIFAWLLQDDLSSSAIVIFAEVDNIAQTMRGGIAVIEPPLGNLRELVGQVEAASEEIARNVSEEGILTRLLPQSAADSLTASSQSLRDNFTTVYDLLQATSDMLLALDNIPFVDIPEKGLSTIAALQGSLEALSDQVETLKGAISDVRSETGARISQVTDAAAFLGSTADQFQSDLNQIDMDLDAIQISVRNYQRLSSPVVLTSAIIFSLLSGWVVYSQVRIIYQSGRHNREKTNHVSEQPDHRLDEGN